MNNEAQVPEEQTEAMTEPQMDAVSGGGNPVSAIEAELAALQKMEQQMAQATAAAAQAELKAFETLISDLTHLKP